MADIVFNDFTYLEKYKPAISQKAFWLEVNEQLNKDFNNTFSINIDEEDIQGEHVAEIFVKELEKELPSFTPRLSEILYRIDVPEASIEALKNAPGDIYYRCLAEIIFKRIILKVALRKMFSGKNNQA
jgi:hypothetical protein